MIIHVSQALFDLCFLFVAISSSYSYRNSGALSKIYSLTRKDEKRDMEEKVVMAPVISFTSQNVRSMSLLWRLHQPCEISSDIQHEAALSDLGL